MGTFGPHQYIKTCLHTHTVMSGKWAHSWKNCVWASACQRACVHKYSQIPGTWPPPLVKFTMCAIMWLWHGYCYDLNWRGTAESNRWERTPGLCSFTAAYLVHGFFFFMDRSFVTTTWILSGIYTLVETHAVSPLSLWCPFTPATYYIISALHLRGCHHRCSRDLIGWKKAYSSRCFLLLTPHPTHTLAPNPPNLTNTLPPQPPSCFPEDLVGEHKVGPNQQHTHTFCLRICLPEFFVGYTFFLKRVFLFLHF